MQMAMGLLNPQQKQILNSLNGLSQEQQAQRIADLCNERGISKEQLASMINGLKR